VHGVEHGCRVAHGPGHHVLVDEPSEDVAELGPERQPHPMPGPGLVEQGVDDGVELGVDLLDAGDGRFHELGRRHLP
jgi:hypothetical protein